MSMIKSVVTASKVLGTVVAVINVQTGRAAPDTMWRAAANLYGVSKQQAKNMTVADIIDGSSRVIATMVPPGFSPLANALTGLCRMFIRSAERKQILISHAFLHFIFDRALQSETIVEYLHRDPDYADGDLTADDVIGLLYSSSPALADAIEALEETPYNQTDTAEFKQLVSDFDTHQEEVDA